MTFFILRQSMAQMTATTIFLMVDIKYTGVWKLTWCYLKVKICIHIRIHSPYKSCLFYHIITFASCKIKKIRRPLTFDYLSGNS